MSSPAPHKNYTDLLLTKELGYPLYYPDPCENQRRSGWTGVSIGDVGTVNNLGGFDFKFNVIEKPITFPDPTSDELDMPGVHHEAVGETGSMANGLPLHAGLSFLSSDKQPQFQHIVLEEGDIRYLDNDCHPGAVIGENITYTLSVKGKILPQIPPIRAGLTFNIECSGERAASLILPDGATRMEVRDEQLEQFFNLARQHGASWLRLFPFTGTSLCLVTGCVKTSNWALMSLYGYSKTGGLPMKFGVAPRAGLLSWNWLGAGPLSWSWLEAGPAHTRRSKNTGDSNRNQCVFLRGFTISKKIPKLGWRFPQKGEQIHVNVNVLGTSENFPFNKGGSNNSASGSTTGAPTSGGSSSSNSGGQHNAGQAALRNLSQNVDGGNTDSKSVITPDIGSEYLDDDIDIEPPTEMPVSNHPSEIINQRLLHENPSAEFAMTHDDQWAKVISNIDTPLDEEALWLLMFEKNDIIVESGCVFFAEKETVRVRDPESPDPITQIDNLPMSNHPEDVHGSVGSRSAGKLPRHFKLPSIFQGPSDTDKPGPPRGVFPRSNDFWPCGTKDEPLMLGYSFFQPADNIIQRNRESKIQAVMKHIEEHVPGIKFMRLLKDSDAAIRIAFDDEHRYGNTWSRVGREAEYVSFKEPTMNLSEVTGRESGDIQEGSKEYGDIMQELLHALGMHHEHQHPDRPFNISPIAVRNNMWSEASINDNIVTRFNHNTIGTYSNYPIPRKWTKDVSEVKRNNKPSDVDWAWLNLMYPPQDSKMFEQALFMSGISKEQWNSIVKLYLDGEWYWLRSKIISDLKSKSSKKGVMGKMLTKIVG